MTVGRRLLLISQPTSGGTAVVVRQLARAAVASGLEVTVAGPDEGELRGWVELTGARWQTLPMHRSLGFGDLRALILIRRLLRHTDAVHLHSSKSGALGRLAGMTIRRRPRIVFTPHAWSWYVGGRGGPLYARFERWAAAHCDLITVTSTGEQADGYAVLGPHAALQIIENGVDTTDFAPTGPVADRDSAPLLVCVGRLCRQKGQDRLIDVLARSEHPSARLRLIGDGPDRDALAERALAAGVRDRVEFLGSADPRPHLRAADVVVSASRWEGMSLVLLEAMACAATVVSTDCGGSTALEPDAGVVVHGESDDAVVRTLVAELDALLADPARRQRLAENARVTCENDHALSRVTDQFHAAWRL